MGLEFISRTLRTSGIVLLISLFFGIYYFGPLPAIAFFSAGVWGMLNLMFLSALVRVAIRPGGADVGSTIAWMVLKFPLLYLSGYALLKVPGFDVVPLLLGFTLILAVITLKAFGRAILKVDLACDNSTHQSTGGAV
jgi:hypothetical protein